MALVKCRECGKEVSDQASSCPNCDYQLTPQQDIASEAPVKKTSVKWMSVQLTGTIMIIIGLFNFGMSDIENSGILPALLSFTFLLFGILLLFAGRITERFFKKKK